MGEDWREKWFGRRRWPFFRSTTFGHIDEIFRQMEKVMRRQFKEFSKRTMKNPVRERTLPNRSRMREFGPFVFGYSVNIGRGGKPHIRQFGNVKPRTRFEGPRVNIREQREPLVDILETDGDTKVIIEIPGVAEKDIQLHGTETSLSITVDTAKLKYFKEVQLPIKIDPKQAKSTYKNGVLEVTVPKRKEEKPEGEPIEIR